MKTLFLSVLSLTFTHTAAFAADSYQCKVSTNIDAETSITVPVTEMGNGESPTVQLSNGEKAMVSIYTCSDPKFCKDYSAAYSLEIYDTATSVYMPSMVFTSQTDGLQAKVRVVGQSLYGKEISDYLLSCTKI